MGMALVVVDIIAVVRKNVLVGDGRKVLVGYLA
jgi:hypothetical protein